MRRATITIPDDLEEALERFTASQPAPPSLTAVAQAALAAYLRKDGTDPGTGLTGVLRRRPQIRQIVADHGGRDPALFGSLARGEAGATSDIDLLVDDADGTTLFDLAAMRAELEDLLQRSVERGAAGRSRRCCPGTRAHRRPAPVTSDRPAPDRIRLEHVLDAIARIDRYTGAERRSLDDQMTRDAVERCLTIVGDALAALTPTTYRRLPSLPPHLPRRQRNILVHEYWRIDLEIVWNTISRDLPRLRADVGSLLAE